MYTTKSLVKSVLTLGLVAVLSSYGLAAGQSHEQMSDQPYQWGWGQQESYSSATDMRLGKASELIGSSLKNPQGQKLGTIYDLVLTEDLDNVSYVALSRGGLLGIGRNLYAVPWSAVQLGAAGNYILPVSEEEFMQWRGFRSSAWPDSVTRSWASEVSGTGEPVAHHGQMTEEKRPVQDRRATRIIGTTVKTPEGLTAGTIDDMVIALDDGEIQYVVVSFGGFLGLGEKFTVVPHDSIELDSDRRLARVNVGREVLR